MPSLRLLAFSLGCCAVGAVHGASLASGCTARAPRLVDSLAAHDYAAANQQLGPLMRLMFSPEQLQLNWDAMTHENGAYQSHRDPVVVQDDGKDAFVRVPMTFAHRTNTMQIVCSKDSHGEISSLAFL